MSRLFFLLFAVLLLSSCMSLPGSESEPSLRFDLPMPDQGCNASDRIVALTITEVSPSLDSDRVARRNAATGEVDYLKDVRWVGRSNELVENALARDLECRGFTVLSGRHRRGEHDQLVCELRSLNLVQARGRDEAEVQLSCMLFREGADDVAIVAGGSSVVDRWSATRAMHALGMAYRQAVGVLIDALSR